MERFVDADKLSEQITTEYCGKCGIYNGELCCSCPMNDALNYIETSQTADVVLRAGDVTDTNVGCKWCEDEDALDNLVCYISADNGSSIDPPVRYCPFCGRRIFEEEQT